jgi:guanylate kinase
MSVAQLSQTYEPDQRAIDIVRAADILLLAGISGAGKDTIQKQLLQKDGYHRIVTHTTRQPRENNGTMEQDGREYHFVSFEQMQDLLERHQLIEVNQYGVNFYGTSVTEFETAKNMKKIAIGDIDVNGVEVFRRIASDNVRALFLIPPDYATWRQRLSSRYQTNQEFESEYPARRTTAIQELEHTLSVPYYHFIINDDLARAVRVTDEIAHRKDMFNQHDDEARLKARELLASIKSDQLG